MTRIEQALRWWRNHDGGQIPARHARVLRKAGMLVRIDDGSVDEMWDLSTKGRAAIRQKPTT